MSNNQAQNRAHTSAILWTLTAAGTMVYLTIHLLTTIVRIAAGESIPPLDSAALWGFSIYYSLLCVPPLLATVVVGKAAAWAALVLGAVLALMNIAAGIKYGLEPGSAHLIAATAFAIALPGLSAVLSNWRWIRSL